MGKRTITVTAPDGATVTVNVGPTRQVGAIRLMDVGRAWGDDHYERHGRWAESIHKTLDNAITGPNQTPAWNSRPRWAIAIGEDDQPVGSWLPASK